MLSKERLYVFIDEVARDLPLIPIIGDGPCEPITPATAFAYLEGYADGLRAAHAALERFRVKVRGATEQLNDDQSAAGYFSGDNDWL